MRSLFAVLIGLVAVALFLVFAQLAFNEGAIVAIVPPLAAAVVSIVFTPLAAVPSRLPLGVADGAARAAATRTAARARSLATSLVGSSVLIVSVTLVLQATDALERQELSTVNQRFEVRGSQGAPQNQVLVAIDDYTFTLPPKPHVAVRPPGPRGR